MNERVMIGGCADLTILGLRTILTKAGGFRVIATACGLPDLIAGIAWHQPDVVIVSERLYPAHMLEVVDQVRASGTRARLVVIGTVVEGRLIRDLLAWGADAYLYSDDDLTELLIPALASIRHGQPYLSPTANAEYLIAMKDAEGLEPLSPEAVAILQRLAAGEDAGEIAYALGIRKRRVYWVRDKLRRRFGARTNEHLISRASQEGFIYPVE